MWGRLWRQSMPSASRISPSRPLTAERMSLVRTKRSELAGIAADARYRGARKRLANVGGNAIFDIGFVPQPRLHNPAPFFPKAGAGLTTLLHTDTSESGFCKIPVFSWE